MAGWLDALLQRLAEVPQAILLLVLALAAALENLIPPIPADAVILFGGFLLGKGASAIGLAFLVVWLANVSGALLVYALGRAYGPGFFRGRLGQYLVKPRQLASLSAFYHRYGFAVIFFGRFLPVFRSVVPVFAGVSNLSLFRTAVPVALASGIWYGGILYLGAVAGQNWRAILAALERGGAWLYVVTALCAAAIFLFWWRSRNEPPPA
jgi:membrane protein DedA with SNARE-associated domain